MNYQGILDDFVNAKKVRILTYNIPNFAGDKVSSFASVCSDMPSYAEKRKEKRDYD